MKEYQTALDVYADDFYEAFFHVISNKEWGDKKIAEEYLKKYWLSKQEYEKIWKPIQDSIFINQDKTLPHMMFADSYSIIALRGGGSVFEPFNFRQLQKCMLALGDTHFVIIQQEIEEWDAGPLFLKYPVTISWKELMSGDYISTILVKTSLFSFFIYSNSGIWGKYIDTDAYFYCVDLIGFKKEYKAMFQRAFPVTSEEERTIWRNPVTKKQDMPEAYKKKLINTSSQDRYKLSLEDERKNLIGYYLDKRYSMTYSWDIPEKEWQNIKGAEEYLKNYWLPHAEYEKIWKPIQDSIFINQDKIFSEVIFAESYSLMTLPRGYLFTQERLEKLQECMRAIGDLHFVVIQSNLGGVLRNPLFRLRYPINISWEEFRSDNFISSIVCMKRSYNRYFIFGDSNAWGLYSEWNLLGFKPEYTQLFRDAFPVSAEEEKKAWEGLPKVYTSGANRKRFVSTAKIT